MVPHDEVQRLLRNGPMGLFLDVDGTLSPIASAPDEAVVSSGVREAIRALAPRLTVVALTGRDVASARGMLGVDTITYAGNHGMEWWEDGASTLDPEAERYLPRMHRVAEAAGTRFGAIPGVAVEDKGPTVSLHFRNAADPDALREAMLEFARGTPEASGLVVTEGKMMVELRAPAGVDKGTALRRVVEARGLRSAMALGDDMTDIDAFNAIRALRQRDDFAGLAVAVSAAGTRPEVAAAADHTLEGPAEVEELLTWLAAEVS